jgi:hypothetical protein
MRAASLSLDLDNLWSYMKTAGIAGWEDFPSYLDLVTPRILERLDRHGLKITFFIVGQDAALKQNTAALRMIADAGHEIANHSFHHEPWLSRASRNAMNAELQQAEDAIGEATGRRTVGFRGPSFCLSTPLLETLCERGYEYDASTLPTFLGPLARAYYFTRSDLTAEDRKKRSLLFGSLADGLRPIRPYQWKLKSGSMIEIPVTMIPVARAPFHLTYLAFLATHSNAAATAYWKAALTACRTFAVQPSVLLHPLDFLGSDDLDILSRFPGMKLPSERKLAIVDMVLSDLARTHRVLTMRAHTSELKARNMTQRQPSFEADAATLSA